MTAFSELSQKDKALFDAMHSIGLEATEDALKNGANVNATDRDGYTPLMTAALKGNKDIAELLLKHGAKMNATEKYGERHYIKL